MTTSELSEKELQELAEIQAKAKELQEKEGITEQEALAETMANTAGYSLDNKGTQTDDEDKQCDMTDCLNEIKCYDGDGQYCYTHAPTESAPIAPVETQEEKDAEAATDQGDDTDPELAAWNEAAPQEVVEQGKSQDEIILERLMANMFDPDEATKFTKCLFYGDMGTSKTIAACDTGGLPVMLVAIENGAKSLRNHPEVMKNVKKIMKVKSVQQVELLAEQLQKGAFPEFEVIVLDTFSELQKKDLDIMVDEGYAADRSKARWTPEGKMYQGNTEHLRRIAAAFSSVDRHVVFVTHEKEDKDDMSRMFFRPDVTPKVSTTLGSYVDIFIRFTAEVDEQGYPRFLGQCRRTPGVTAKTRIGALPTIIETPTFKLIHEADQTYTAQEKAKAGNN